MDIKLNDHPLIVVITDDNPLSIPLYSDDELDEIAELIEACEEVVEEELHFFNTV